MGIEDEVAQYGLKKLALMLGCCVQTAGEWAKKIRRDTGYTQRITRRYKMPNGKWGTKTEIRWWPGSVRRYIAEYELAREREKKENPAG